jgi:hypothetical protein
MVMSCAGHDPATPAERCRAFSSHDGRGTAEDWFRRESVPSRRDSRDVRRAGAVVVNGAVQMHGPPARCTASWPTRIRATHIPIRRRRGHSNDGQQDQHSNDRVSVAGPQAPDQRRMGRRCIGPHVSQRLRRLVAVRRLQAIAIGPRNGCRSAGELHRDQDRHGETLNQWRARGRRRISCTRF